MSAKAPPGTGNRPTEPPGFVRRFADPGRGHPDRAARKVARRVWRLNNAAQRAAYKAIAEHQWAYGREIDAEVQ